MACPVVTPVSLRLRELREAKGLSQVQLSSLSDVPQPIISRLESGRQASISFAQLEALANALDVDAALLIRHVRGSRRGG
jgi:transcriptional regulator with XRE-family HTH domain